MKTHALLLSPLILPRILPSDDTQQKAQYEEWLRETQQLLQMQQKFLEEQIGAHRKSKKALSAKQRTAKKAGREFPEEDAEQLKHVTEQQGVVQKQLEQVMLRQRSCISSSLKTHQGFRLIRSQFGY